MLLFSKNRNYKKKVTILGGGNFVWIHTKLSPHFLHLEFLITSIYNQFNLLHFCSLGFYKTFAATLFRTTFCWLSMSENVFLIIRQLSDQLPVSIYCTTIPSLHFYKVAISYELGQRFFCLFFFHTKSPPRKTVTFRFIINSIALLA